MYLRIEESQPEQIGSDPARNDGHPLRSLSEMLREDGVAKLVDPDGIEHRFTFAPWTDRDPDTTFLSIRFIHFNPELYGKGKLRPLPAKGTYEL